MKVADFPAKLALAMKVLSIGRGGLAAEVRVDKSVVSRWVNGVNAPTDDNLAGLSTALGARCPGFNVLDWDRDLEGFARTLRRRDDADGARSSAWVPDRVLEEAILATETRGGAYEGFWRTTRPSTELTGQFVHDRVMIRREGHGLLGFRLSVGDMRFQGVAFPGLTQIFGLCADPNTGVFLFVIFNAVLRYRADVMDGLSLTLLRSGGGAPVASAVLMERTGMLGDDPVADDVHHEASCALARLAPEGSIPADIAAHLIRDIGPAAHAAGGDLLLMMRFAGSLSRGPDPEIPFPH